MVNFSKPMHPIKWAKPYLFASSPIPRNHFFNPSCFNALATLGKNGLLFTFHWIKYAALLLLRGFIAFIANFNKSNQCDNGIILNLRLSKKKEKYRKTKQLKLGCISLLLVGYTVFQPLYSLQSIWNHYFICSWRDQSWNETYQWLQLSEIKIIAFVNIYIVVLRCLSCQGRPLQAETGPPSYHLVGQTCGGRIEKKCLNLNLRFHFTLRPFSRSESITPL